MTDWHGQHKENDWKLWNQCEYLSIPVQDIGTWGIPRAKRCDHIPDHLIPFNYAIGKKTFDPSACVHFFINDYQFERIWTSPEKYLGILEKFDSIIAPDFSVYNDMATALQIYQLFKSRLIAYLAYQRGIKVIPNLIFSDSRTYSRKWGFAFDGIDDGGTVCLSTSGCRRNPGYRKGIERGVSVYLETHEPKTIIVYGDRPDVDFGNINVVEFSPFSFGDYVSRRRV